MKFSLVFASLLLVSQQAQAQLRDVKPPVDYPSLLPMILLVVCLVLGALGIYCLIRRLRSFPNANNLKKPSPWQKAKNQLEALAQEELLQQGKLNEYYSRLSDSLRRYIEERFSIRAPEMTTEEFLVHLQSSSDLLAEQKEALTKFLRSCDMVKFAKYHPDPSEAKQSYELALAFIEETIPKEADIS